MDALVMTLLAAAPAADAAFLREYAETRRYLAGRPVSVRVTPDGREALFLRSGPKDSTQVLHALDLESGRSRELLTPEAVLRGAAEHLTAAEKARLERQRVSARGFTSYQLSPDGSRLLVALSGRLSVVERATGAVLPLATGEGACIDPKFSPDGARVAYVRGHDVFAVELARNVERRVTRGGTEEKPHGLAEFVAQEEMGRFSGFWFSPDGKAVAFQETDHAGMEVFGINDPLHPERQADRFHYPRPGKRNAVVRLGLQKLSGGPPTWVTWDAQAYPYLATVTWKNGPLTLVVQDRAQTRSLVLAVDAATGRTTTLHLEEDAAWVNLDQALPLWWRDTGFFWRTERNGGAELELRAPTGALLGSWVPPSAGLDDVVGFDAATKTLYFTGGPDPTASALFRVVAGGPVEAVKTPASAQGNVLAALTGGDRFVALTHTSLEAMPRSVVLRPDTGAAVEVPSVALEPSLSLKMDVFQAGEAGQWVAVLTPRDFVKGRKYPVILNVYGGPHHQEVLRVKRENLVLQWLADQGFIVVKTDGRGTPRRTREWERAIKHDFASVTSAMQVEALALAARRVPELDLSRVGAYGWSFGGYLAALLALHRGDAVKTAVAGAPVVDWLDYDTHYTERYLGLPDAHPEAYARSSLLTYVPEARRPLLLLHGTADDNVYFLHTLKLSDALFRAGKPHAVLPLANFTHMVPDPLVMERQWELIATWFKERL